MRFAIQVLDVYLWIRCIIPLLLYLYLVTLLLPIRLRWETTTLALTSHFGRNRKSDSRRSTICSGRLRRGRVTPLCHDRQIHLVIDSIPDMEVENVVACEVRTMDHLVDQVTINPTRNGQRISNTGKHYLLRPRRQLRKVETIHTNPAQWMVHGGSRL